jgi:hypothetical protein
MKPERVSERVRVCVRERERGREAQFALETLVA